MNREERLQALFAKLEERELTALLISHPPDLNYLFGFTGSAGRALLWEGRARLFVDSRYTLQAREETANCEILETVDPVNQVRQILRRGSRLGIQGDHLSYCEAREIFERLVPDTVVRPEKGLLSELRIRKSQAEIDRIRAACQKALKAWQRFLSDWDRQGTEIQTAALLDYTCRCEGAGRNAFETIVAGGARSALPHAAPGPARLNPDEPLLIDFGIVLESYCSDLTRCILPPGRHDAAEIYRIVEEAQQAAVACIKPGISTLEVDRAARNVIRDAGYGDCFGHGTGHGIGLELHELPRISFRGEQDLEPGMVFTVEPGIYLPGRFGIRLEEVVAVTDRGAEILSLPQPGRLSRF